MELSLSSSLLLLLLSLLPLVVYLFYLRTQQRHHHGLKVYPVVGTLPHFIKNRHRFLEWSTGVLQRSPTHTMSMKVLGRPGSVFTANPANLEHVLKTNFENYPKGELVDLLDDFLGHGIFNSDGEEWLQQRKTASYEFNRRSLRNFVVDVVRFEVVERLLPLLERATRREEALNFLDVLEGFAFDNICRVAFAEDPACLAEQGVGWSSRKVELMQAFDVATDTLMIRVVSPSWLWRLMRLLDLGPERKMRRALATIHGYADKIIRQRRERVDTGKDDLLSRFAASGGQTHQGLIFVITNFILGGRDAAASSVSWLFWLVSSRPEVEDKILSEIRAVRARAGSASTSTFSVDELREMHYLHAAITESMRLYPPVAVNSRTCNLDDHLPDGTFVGKGWQMSYCAYAMARLEDLWGQDCQVFRPERWLDEAGAFRPENPFKYPVFNAGPRSCLGKEMAYIQMKSIVACVYERFTLRYLGGEGHPGLNLSGTLHMAGGLPMKITPRDPSS